MKPTKYRITHLWPNKQPGHGSMTAQIEEDQERRRLQWWLCESCGETAYGDWGQAYCKNGEAKGHFGEQPRMVPYVPATVPSSTVQIKPETDELNALPSRFVSLQDYEALEREARS